MPQPRYARSTSANAMYGRCTRNTLSGSALWKSDCPALVREHVEQITAEVCPRRWIRKFRGDEYTDRSRSTIAVTASAHATVFGDDLFGQVISVVMQINSRSPDMAIAVAGLNAQQVIRSGSRSVRLCARVRQIAHCGMAREGFVRISVSKHIRCRQAMIAPPSHSLKTACALNTRAMTMMKTRFAIRRFRRSADRGMMCVSRATMPMMEVPGWRCFAGATMTPLRDPSWNSGRRSSWHVGEHLEK